MSSSVRIFSRRQMLGVSLALGGFVMSTPVRSVLAHPTLSPTPGQILGPFYPVKKPKDQDADLTTIQDEPGRAEGQVIYLMGRVLNLQGKPVRGARVEIWQTNAAGRYIHPSDRNPAPRDPYFQGFGVQVTDAQGRYRFKTIKPGAYPTTTPGWMRPPHIHFQVTGRIDRLVTQMYFDGEPLNDKDPLLQCTPAKERLIVKLQPPTPDLEPGSLVADWDIVILQG